MAWQETFWAHGFGKTIDRFGVPWMVNVVKQA
jgi:PhnB protein